MRPEAGERDPEDECVATDPWIFDYACHQIGGDANLVHLPHVPNMNIEESLRTN